MKERSLKNQIVRYGVVSVVAAFLFIVATYLFNQYLNLKQSLDFEGNKLVSTSSKQVEQILPGLLVAEEYGSIDLQLTRIKDAEGLVSASYVKALDGSLASVRVCPMTGRTYICTSYLNSELVTATEIGLSGDVIGYLIKRKSLSSLRSDDHIMLSLGVLFGCIATVFLGLIISLLVFVDRHLRKPLLNLKDHIGPVLEGDKGKELNRFVVAEVQEVAKQVEELVERFQEKKVAAAQGELAAQVAHDIRSPLTLLNLIAKEASGLSEENRRLLGLAAARINKIASGLLDKYRNDGKQVKATTSFALAIVERIIMEKRAMHRASNCEIDLVVHPSAASAFVAVNSTELGRAISNVIENSVEACADRKAKVLVSLASDEIESLRIEITDNGRGMSPELLGQVGQRGVTSGKLDGNGLGLYHAKALAESAGGQFEVESDRDSGTVVRLTLPRVEAPSWFTGTIPVGISQKFIAVDDDPTMHVMWSQIIGTNLEAFYVEINEELKSKTSDPELFFLVDNQISNTGIQGIDFVSEMHLGSRALLITNDFEDEALQARCVQVGCRIIPKPLLPYLAIGSKPALVKQDFDLVLIDNDELMRLSWQIRARDLKKRVGIFENLNAFLGANVSTATPVYIDFHLDSGVSGLDVAAQLNKLGYNSIFITTGDDKVTDLPPYIKSVQGKDFPAA
jgi:signal transduction histidine kinase